MTAIISAFIAVPLALLITFYNFPGNKFFSWSLSLSIAFPAYVYAFIYVGIFEYASPISTFLRDFNISLPSIKNLLGASIIMSMALFPYIYLLVKVQLSSMGINLFKASKTLGKNNIETIFKVIIPSLWPAIVGGMSLVIFETVADFGGVSTLRIETFTVGIYNAWFGYQSYYSAAKLAGYLFVFVVAVILISKYYDNKQINLASRTSEIFEKTNLNTVKAYLATTICTLIFLVVFVAPLIQLFIWSLSKNGLFSTENIYLFFNSLVLGISASLVTVFFAISLALTYSCLLYTSPSPRDSV